MGGLALAKEDELASLHVGNDCRRSTFAETLWEAQSLADRSTAGFVVASAGGVVGVTTLPLSLTAGDDTPVLRGGRLGMAF